MVYFRIFVGWGSNTKLKGGGDLRAIVAFTGFYTGKIQSLGGRGLGAHINLEFIIAETIVRASETLVVALINNPGERTAQIHVYRERWWVQHGNLRIYVKY